MTDAESLFFVLVLHCTDVLGLCVVAASIHIFQATSLFEQAPHNTDLNVLKQRSGFDEWENLWVTASVRIVQEALLYTLDVHCTVLMILEKYDGFHEEESFYVVADVHIFPETLVSELVLPCTVSIALEQRDVAANVRIFSEILVSGLVLLCFDSVVQKPRNDVAMDDHSCYFVRFRQTSNALNNPRTSPCADSQELLVDVAVVD